MNSWRMGKKGIFFTLIALTLVAILIIVFARTINTSKDSGATFTRIQFIDAFVKDAQDSFLPLASRASSYRAIQAASAYMNATGQFLQDPEHDLASAMVNGTIGADAVMVNSTLTNFTDYLEILAKESHGIDMEITVHDARFSQSSPWQVDIEVNASILAIGDVGNWSREGLLVRSSVPIEGFYDPQYLVGGAGYGHIFQKSNFSAGPWNLSMLDSFITKGEYLRIEGSSAPSFLERFKSTPLSSECCAIESTIEPDRVSPSDQQKSYVDYQFFADSVACEDLYSISSGNFPHPGFKLDFAHVVLYNVSAYAQEITCI
ncbi:MAG TPA: hypothetical protein VJB12_02540 [Candidatus Nanoarchaeia archaeon]|nr:hypothetical protein [Candidatus Nanoarchaeia archaeon]